MRLGDLDTLEKRMNERLNFLRKAYGEHDDYVRGFDEGCVAVENAPTIDPATFAPKWVSVKERLPTTEEMVLVLFENGDIMNATYEGNIDDVSQFGTYRGYYDFDTLGFLDSKWIPYEGITHWMPIPHPPKGE